MELQHKIKSIVLSVAAKSGADPSPSEALFETGVLDSFGLTDLPGRGGFDLNDT